MSASKFCILTLGRSGSNYLLDALNSIPEVVCHGEVFSSRRLNVLRFAQWQGTIEERDSDPLAFMRGIHDTTMQHRPGARAVGFKLFFWHNDAALEHVINSGEYRLVVLERENLLAQFSSLQLANLTGSWKAGAGSVGAQPQTIEFNAKMFEGYCQRTRKMAADAAVRIAAAGRPVFNIAYTQLHSQDVLAALIRFLGVEPEKPAVGRLRKQNPGRVIDRFTDPPAVSRYLADKKLEHWADE